MKYQSSLKKIFVVIYLGFISNTLFAQSNFVVTNTNDDGAGSLRQAIDDANVTPNLNATTPDTISFNIPGPNPHVITPDSRLSFISETLFIDGWSQPGWANTPVIEINGTNVSSSIGLWIEATNCTVRGLAVNNFAGTTLFSGIGIFISSTGSGSWIYGCNLGVDASGLIARPNGQQGLYIIGSGAVIGTNGDGINDALERNVISANSEQGILVEGSNNTIAGNYIGIGSDGLTNLGNIGAGIYLSNCVGNIIGGTIATQRNIISANAYGIIIDFALHNQIQGNFIGTRADGITAVGNIFHGIQINNSGTNIITGNTIAFSNVGINIVSGRGIDIQKNSIFSNSNSGISLNGNAGNDFGDADTGPNNLQNTPDFTVAQRKSNGDLLVNYLVSSVDPNSVFPLRIDFYKGQNGQGKTFLGSQTYASGNVQVIQTFTPEAAMATGDQLLATATDGSGSTSEFSAGVPVTTLCQITCPDNIVVSNDPGRCGAVVTFAPGTTGDCGAVETDPQSGTFFPVGTTTLTANSLSTAQSCLFTVTVKDTTPPTITCPETQTLFFNENCSVMIPDYSYVVADDNCGKLTVTQFPEAFTVYTGGTAVTVHLFAEDASGNKTTCSFSLVFEDHTPPHIICPANITVPENPAGSGGASVPFKVSATDNCSSVSFSTDVDGEGISSPHTFPVGVTTVHVYAINFFNVIADSSFTVTVTPITRPKGITCPGNICVNNDRGKCGAVVKYQVTAAPNCGKLTYSKASGTLFPIGTTDVIVRSPSTGESCSFKVRVTDNEKPTIKPPANVNKAGTNHTGCSVTGVNLGKPVTKDNCAVQSVWNNAPSAFPLGTTVVEWTAKDIHGNLAKANQVVTVASTLGEVLTADIINCNGGTTTLKAQASGSTGYSYSFNGASYKTGNIFTVKAGTYCITVKDSKGCIFGKCITIGQPDAIKVSAVAGTIVSSGGTTKVTVSATGGKPGYSGTGTFTRSAGTYTFTVFDSKGCKGSKTITISQPAALTASVYSKTNVSCYGGKNGSVTVKANNGTAPYTYKINTASSWQSSATFNNLPKGNYSVIIKDKNSASTTLTGIMITQPPACLQLALTQKKDVSCYNGSNGSIKVSASGGTGPYKYKLNSGSYGSNVTFPSLRAGVYTITVKDANGCTTSISATIKNSTVHCNPVAAQQREGGIKISDAKIISQASLEAKISPNPSAADFTLLVKGNSREPVNIRVIDMLGRPVHQTKGVTNQYYKFGQSLVPGAYIVEVLQDKAKKAIKIIKQ